ncbi:hypothetical protein ABIA31_002923 [Catenulispora sp. MAP5-51]|uniref:hypothetical protein n=1 Tax=Catenulispora sp. MAP5-51 TaxID=3156298 RepID=UPI00351530CD
MDPAIAARFPLIAKPRPAGRPLAERLAALVNFATDARDEGHHDKVVRASGVINTTSLIASDVGLHDLAETLSWQHYQAFADAPDLDAATAVAALQPLINIARLMTRRSNGQQAFRILGEMYQAARQRGVADLGSGLVADLGAVIRGDKQHHDVCLHLWATLLEDGLRALLAAGQWQRAADEAAKHKGVGPHLWTGRQAVILARLHAGEAKTAAEMVDASEPTNPEEHAVQALLYSFCALDGQLQPDRLGQALSQAQQLITTGDPTNVYFRTQAALTAISLAKLAGDTDDPQLHEATISAASTDAYAARAVVALLGDRAGQLRAVVAAGGLDNGAATRPGLAGALAMHAHGAVDRIRWLLGAPHAAAAAHAYPLT